MPSQTHPFSRVATVLSYKCAPFRSPALVSTNSTRHWSAQTVPAQTHPFSAVHPSHCTVRTLYKCSTVQYSTVLRFSSPATVQYSTERNCQSLCRSPPGATGERSEQSATVRVSRAKRVRDHERTEPSAAGADHPASAASPRAKRARH